MTAERLLFGAAREDTLRQAYLITAGGDASCHAACMKFLGAVFCHTHEGCGTCPGCRQLAAGSTPDLLQVTSAARIKKEDVEEIREFIKNKSMTGGKRVILIERAHDLTPNSQNFLLKTLEEPQEGVVLVLGTHLPQALLSTVRSRCTRVHIHPLGAEELEQALAGKVPAEDLPWLMAASGGYPEEAMELAGAEGLKEARQRAGELVTRLTKKNPSLFRMEQLLIASPQPEATAQTVTEILRDALYLALKANAPLCCPDQEEASRLAARCFTSGAIEGIIELWLTALSVRRSCPGHQIRLWAEKLLLDTLKIRSFTI